MIDGSSILHGLGDKAIASQFRRMIDGIDKDGDGLITFDEFMVWWPEAPRSPPLFLVFVPDEAATTYLCPFSPNATSSLAQFVPNLCRSRGSRSLGTLNVTHLFS
jgi:hypothetical protein